MSKRNPFNDGSDNEREANERAAAKVKERAVEAAPTHDDEPVRVDLDEADDDAEPERETTQEASARKERRANRYREQVEERKRLAEENAKLREEAAQLRTQRTVAETMQQFMPRQPPPPDPIDREIALTEQSLENVQKEFRRMHADRAAAGAPMSQEEIDQWNAKARDLDRRANALHTQKLVRSQGRQAPQQDVTVAAQEAYLHMQFPDVMSDPLKRQYATVQAQKIMRDEGRSVADMAVVQRAIEMAREAFGGQAAPRRGSAPSAGMRAKFGGASAGSARGGDEGGNRVVEMGTHEKRMARAMYPNMDEREAYKRWATKVGAKRQEG